MKYKIQEGKKGFSLYELIVVIAVTGILAGIIIAVAVPARNKARDAKIQSDLLQIQNRAELIYLDEGNYDNVDPALSPEILALQNDIVAQGSELKIYNWPFSYCAYADLITEQDGSQESFCIDSSGLAVKVADFNESFCSIWQACLLTNFCYDFNCDGIVNFDGFIWNGDTVIIINDDLDCLVNCTGADWTEDPPFIPGLPQVCPRLPPECYPTDPKTYDLNNNNIIDSSDMLLLVGKIGEICLTPPPWCP